MRKRKKIPQCMLTRKLQESGIYLGMTNKFFQKHFVCKPANVEGHVAIFGGTSSGKTTSVVKPTLYDTWQNSFVATDIKGDLHREYAKLGHCRPTKVISLRGENGNTYDPLYFIRTDIKDNLTANVQELSNALIKLSLAVDPFWVESARKYLTATILYYLELGADDFIDIALNIMTTPPVNLIEEIAASKSTMAKIFINNFMGSEDLGDSKMLLGISQEVTNSLSIFAADSRVRKTFIPSENSVKWAEDIEKYNIFISIPEDRMEQYGGVVAMMITQLIRTLERRSEMYSPEGTNQSPVLLMLDEFARLGKMDLIASAISTLRSKRVTICLVMQSLAQLEFIYGKEITRIILENCSYKIILNANDAESRRYISELIGTAVIPKASFSTNYDGTHQVSGYNQNIAMSREAVVHPHELGKLKNEAVLLTPDGYCTVNKIQYHSETYKNYKTRELKPSLWQKATSVVQSVKTEIKNAWKKLKSFFSR